MKKLSFRNTLFWRIHSRYSVIPRKCTILEHLSNINEILVTRANERHHFILRMFHALSSVVMYRVQATITVLPHRESPPHHVNRPHI